MIRRSIGALALAGTILAAVVPVTSAASVVVPPSRSSGTIVGIAVANGDFTTLVAAVGCADPAVAAALTSGEQLTVFAPTDDRRPTTDDRPTIDPHHLTHEVRCP
jgi:hypothetical protein